jgi:hypothetical protein
MNFAKYCKIASKIHMDFLTFCLAYLINCSLVLRMFYISCNRRLPQVKNVECM